MKNYRIGQLTLGTLPRVVGTLSTHDFLPSEYRTNDYSCDVVEVRLDEVSPNTHEWMKNCQAIEAAGFPVIVTFRLANEGGKWQEPDEKRESILSTAIENLACIDIELTSKLCVPLCRQAQELGKCIIVSYHNFERTPDFSELKDVLDRILDIPCAIPKISTMVIENADVNTLKKLLETANLRPVCIIGMGSKGTKTRVFFPFLGSCLTYGYLDSPIAPGQLPSSTLIQYMRQLLPEYNQDMVIRKKIMECI